MGEDDVKLAREALLRCLEHTPGDDKRVVLDAAQAILSHARQREKPYILAIAKAARTFRHAQTSKCIADLCEAVDAWEAAGYPT